MHICTPLLIEMWIHIYVYIYSICANINTESDTRFCILQKYNIITYIYIFTSLSLVQWHNIIQYYLRPNTEQSKNVLPLTSHLVWLRGMNISLENKSLKDKYNGKPHTSFTEWRKADWTPPCAFCPAVQKQTQTLKKKTNIKSLDNTN